MYLARQPTPVTCAAAARHWRSFACEVHARYKAGTSSKAMSAEGQLEPGHRPPAAPLPPRREVRNELKPAAAFRIPAGRLQVGYSGATPAVTSTRTTRSSILTATVSPGALEPLWRILLPKRITYQQGSVIPARVPGAEHPAYECAGDPRPLCPPSKRHGLPNRQAQPSAHRLPGRPRPGRLRGPPGGHTGIHARLGDTRQAGTCRRRGPSVAVRGKADGAHRPF